MSTIKISQLPVISILNADTSNTLFVAVDAPSGITGQFTAHTLAQGLYSNEILNVGLLKPTLANTVAQFTGNSSSFIQVNLQNPVSNGSADYVITADNGNDSQYYLDLGISGSTGNDPVYTAFGPNDGYLYVQGAVGAGIGGNLVIGTASQTTNINFMVGGTTPSNFVARMSSANISLLRDTYVAGNTKITGNLTVSSITTSGFNQNLILDPNGSGDVVLPALTELYIQSTAAANSNTVGAVVISGGLAVSGNIYTGGHYLTGTGNGITFVDGTQQITAGSSVANTIYLTGGLNAANANVVYLQTNLNASNSNINYLFGVSTTQNTKTQSAWNTANSAIANTNGVITAGDFVISGNMSTIGFASTGLVTINAISFIANTPAFRISGSSNNYSQTPLNQGYMVQVTGFANVSSRIVNDAFGANSYPVYVGRQARGTALSPQSTANGDILLRLSSNGWGNNFSQFGQGRIDFVAAENFTDTSKGTQIQLWNTITGSNVLSQIATFNATEASFLGDVYPLKGFIYTPLQYPAAQTAITLDFANNSVIRTSITAALTVTPTNFRLGKVVEMWITNTGGPNQNFTHGVSALNSTTNSTTYAIPGTSTVCVKYMSFGTDIANTLVSVVHS